LKDYSFLIVNSGGSHAGLSHLYKAIPDDMFKVAKLFNKQYLRDVDQKLFESNKQEVIDKCGQLAYERAEHFYGENQRRQSRQLACPAKMDESCIV
jgi:galactokinase